jgi:flagellar hook assembly protein FlgD
MRNERPVIDKKDGKPVFGTAAIYDPVGNLVKSDAFIKNADVDRVYYVLWDGINRNHRRVAPGSYLIWASVNIGKTPFRESKKLLIRWK